jgi:tetratricopeptide (TPR) repeat protein
MPRFFAACCENYYGRAQGVSKIQLAQRGASRLLGQAAIRLGELRNYPRAFSMSRNRLLLRRTIEEAEGYIELGMVEHALRALQRRGALVHGNGRACYLLGETLRELARYEDALLPLERSAALVPDDIHVYLALGWCYKRTGQLAKAIDALERAVAVDPGEAILHYNLACYWSLARNRNLALKFLSRALDLDANYRDLIGDEPDFHPLRHDPEFKQLLGVGC